MQTDENLNILKCIPHDSMNESYLKVYNSLKQLIAYSEINTYLFRNNHLPYPNL